MALHDNLAGFMGEWRNIPHGPEKLKFLTAHLSHPPFQRDLAANPAAATAIRTAHQKLLDASARGPGTVKLGKSEATFANRPVLKDTDVDHLATRSALLEFEHGLDRHEADQRAYQEYLQEHHRNAAAHHLRGLRAAQAAGDTDESAKHGEAYHHHMAALGYDSFDQVPNEIKALVEADDRKPHYKFKSHASDALLL